MSSFPYKTEPYSHQREALRFLAKRGKYAGLFMEQRTGKTKVILDEAAWRFMKGEIGALLILAPSGVHTNWVRDEIPLHLSDDVERVVIEWDTGKSKTKWFREMFREAMTTEGKLVILAMNIEVLITDGGKKAIKTLMRYFKTMMVIDESTDIKTAGAKRTRSAKYLGKRAAFRRILSGFPDPEGPLDFYGQLSFLSPEIIGSNVATFKERYGRFEQRYYHGRNAKPVQVLVGYRNLPELTKIVKTHCFRVRRDQVFDLPDKIYQKRYFDLSPEQHRMYAELETDWLTNYIEDQAEVSAPLTIVRLLRLQQIASGYVPTDSGEEPQRRISGPNPRLKALEDEISRVDGQIIIWYRYRMDGDLLEELLGDDVVRWDGTTKKTREEGKVKFVQGKARFFIGSPKAAGRGLTLRMAHASFYFSHYWSLEARVQSEDRQVGEDWPPLYIDIMGKDTVDERIIDALRAKDDLARLVLGDPARKWI